MWPEDDHRCLQEIPRERLGSNTGHSKTKTKRKIPNGRHPGSAGEVFTMTLTVRSSVDYRYMEKCEKRKCIELLPNFFLQLSGQLL